MTAKEKAEELVMKLFQKQIEINYKIWVNSQIYLPSGLFESF